MAIYTSAFWHPEVKRQVLAGEGIAIAITLYPPKKQYDYPIFARIPALAPNRKLFHIEDKGEFYTAFMEKLETTGPKGLFELQSCMRVTPEMNQFLLCFEPVSGPGQWCHRLMTAEYISKNWDVEVTEL
jgi:hypothetical protein